MRFPSRRGLAPRAVPALAATLALLVPLISPSGTARAQACLVESGAPACGGTEDPGANGETGKIATHVGNPIDVVSGNKYQAAHDYRAFDSPLAFNRHYNSGLVDHDLGLGSGWRHSYAVTLSRSGDGYRIVQADGRVVRFGTDVSTGEEGVLFRADALDPADGYLEIGERRTWVVPDGRRLVFHGSWLIAVAYPDGQRLTLRYRARRLETIRDDAGRTLRLVHAPDRRGLPRYGDDAQVPPGHVARLELPDGSAVRYRYDDRANLVSAIDDAGHGLRYAYEHPDRPAHLTGIDDTAGRELGRWRHDRFGRAVAWTAPGANEPVEIDYVDDANVVASGRTRVRYPWGEVDEYRWATRGGIGEPGAYEVLSRETVDDGAPASPGERRRRRAALDPAPAGTPTSVRPSVVDPPGIETREVSVPLGGGERVTVKLEVDRFGGVADVALGASRLSDMVGEIPNGRKLERCDATSFGTTTSEKVRYRVSTMLARDVYAVAPPFCVEDAETLYELALRAIASSEAGASGGALSKRQLGGGSICPLPRGADCDALQEALELAELSACAYPSLPCRTSMQPVSPASIGMRDEEFMLDGQQALLFYDATEDRYVLAFQGTQERSDWADNAGNFLGLNSSQYARAARLARDLELRLEFRSPASDLMFTGHSLGGGLATMAAIATGNRAVVFNPARLHRDTAAWNSADIEDAHELVDVYTTDGDPLSGAQRWHLRLTALWGNLTGRDERPRGEAPGYHFPLPRPEQSWLDSRPGMEMVERHGIEAVMRSLSGLIQLHCP